MHFMNEFRADLHCHSSFSDGSCSPKQILALAKEKGLAGISITDHDTLSAYDEAIPLAKEAGINLLPGIEFSTDFKGHSIHVLAYSFQVSNEHITKFCQKHHLRREERNQNILDRLAKHHMPIKYEEMKATFPLASDNIGRPHIAYMMQQKGYVKDFDEAFKKYIGDGKACHSFGKPFTIEETLDVIHQANGYAIIAHPHLIRNKKILNHLLKMNFDGIEVFYATFPPHHNAEWIKIAQQKNWIHTGGSDFHGDFKPTLGLGSSWVGEETFHMLEKKYKQNCEL